MHTEPCIKIHVIKSKKKNPTKQTETKETPRLLEWFEVCKKVECIPAILIYFFSPKKNPEDV